MAKKKRTSNVERRTSNVETTTPDPEPTTPELPPELALDDAGPPPTDAEQLEGFKEHVAEQGRRLVGERDEKTLRRVGFSDGVGEPAEGPREGPELLDIEVPLGPRRTGYAARHVECRITAGQGRALKRLCDALEAAGARVPVGSGRLRPVQSAADGVRWLLERLVGEEEH